MITSTSDLIKRAMAAADMHDGPTPTQWLYWATKENLALSIFLARAGWTQNVKTETITVSGSEAGDFPLTEAPLAIVAVHQIGTSNLVRRLKCNNAVDFLRQTVSATAVQGDAAEYRVIWDQDEDVYALNFFPQPASGTQFLVSYIAHPKSLTLSASPAADEANSVIYPLGFEERIVLGMARAALAKEESDTSEIKEQIRECQSYIEQAAWDRVFASATVRNVDREERGWTSKILYPAPSAWWFV